MSDFQKEFDQRMRRICGVTNDNYPVKYDEVVHDSYWSGDPLDTQWPAEYEINVYVWKEVGTYKVETLGQRTFSEMSDFLNAVMAVEL